MEWLKQLKMIEIDCNHHPRHFFFPFPSSIQTLKGGKASSPSRLPGFWFWNPIKSRALWNLQLAHSVIYQFRLGNLIGIPLFFFFHLMDSRNDWTLMDLQARQQPLSGWRWSPPTSATRYGLWVGPTNCSISKLATSICSGTPISIFCINLYLIRATHTRKLLSSFICKKELKLYLLLRS